MCACAVSRCPSARVGRRSLAAAVLCAFAVVSLAGACRTWAASTDDDGPVAAPAAADETVQFRFRVIDRARRPVRGAEVRVLELASQEQTATRPLVGRGDMSAVTDSDGFFRTSRPLPAGTAYVAEIKAAGYLDGLSRWTRPSDRGELELPDVVLRQLVRVEGRVVERDGRPVAGVRVFVTGCDAVRAEPGEDTSDAEGRFRLVGIPEGPLLVLAERGGYRFHGQRVESVESEPIQVEIVLEPLAGPTQRRLEVQPLLAPAVPEADARAWALDVLRAQFQQMIAGEIPAQWSFVYNLAAVDPELVLDHADGLARVFRKPYWPREQFLSQVANRICERDFDEAMALARLANKSRIGAAGGGNILLPWSKGLRAEYRRAAVSEGLLLARRVPDAQVRLDFLVSYASELLTLDDKAEALRLLNEAEECLALLPAEASTTRRWRGYLAEVWSPLDTEKAWSLMEAADPAYYVMVAKAIAAEDPAEAERCLTAADLSAREELLRTVRRELPQICFDIALTDAPRAARVARMRLVRARDTQSSSDRPESTGALRKEDLAVAFRQAFVYGLIAEAVAQSDRDSARGYLESAVKILRPLRQGSYEDGSGYFFVTPALVLSTLLPVAERIDPAWGQELFWRALAARIPPPEGEGERRQMHDISLGLLALMLSRYDQQIAMDVLRPVLEREHSRSFNGTEPFRWVPIVYLRLDPDRAARWIATGDDHSLETGLSPRAHVEYFLAHYYLGPQTFSGLDPEERLQANLRLVRQTCQIYVNTQDE